MVGGGVGIPHDRRQDPLGEVHQLSGALPRDRRSILVDTHTVLTLVDHSIDLDDHASVVLRALTVVGDGKLVGGVDGEIRQWPAGKRGHCGGGGRLLCAGHMLCLLGGGHGIFVIVPDLIVVPDLVIGHGFMAGNIAR